MQKVIIAIISFMLGCCITTGAGSILFFFVTRPDRLSIAAVRAELAEYRDRALDSERRLAESITIIDAGEAKLNTAVRTIQQAVQQISVIRGIIQDIKGKLTIQEQGDNHRDNIIDY